MARQSTPWYRQENQIVLSDRSKLKTTFLMGVCGICSLRLSYAIFGPFEGPEFH